MVVDTLKINTHLCYISNCGQKIYGYSVTRKDIRYFLCRY